MTRAFEFYRNNEEAYMWIMTSDPVHDWDSYCDWCDEMEREIDEEEDDWDSYMRELMGRAD